MKTYPKGLLSFTYNAANDPEVRELVLQNLPQAMALFDLSESQQELVQKVVKESFLTDDLWSQYCEELRPEIDDDIAKIW
ncbi:hypothetical protein [Pseudoalteromonas luteoviolacea]|uniref:Uncharacterized protein n=2 Tax=Pseudoalteromonas luteoviolacea TaxID=43657 RepID=A0A166Y8A0_9GAMM|nr:hypothetical protein [Pseudoalteromonas luteoviolacea]KZN41547.1 hypothetical protein N482_19920 [Pseudoalteromonas luteoviolacea NCIMB 1942]KZX00209.1 hypothetical protein JL49_12740 [Pseudoalteromonas luteoviolacea]MBQ4811374.1 hypothetical protein [Pseudoalteromonas luteoviolacea]OCQ21148.1 hypothetical protein A7985_10970 [Pseudoalteromonas luteoviolacea]